MAKDLNKINKIKKLTKADLINVIANMHDTILDWDSGWGFSDEDAETIKNVGSMCCESTDTIDLSEIRKKI